jgi:hypothetical protein
VTLALAPTQTEVAIAQLDALRRDLDAADLTLPDILAVRDRAAAIRSWSATARLGRSVANDAMETVLVAERKAGALLLEITETSGPSTRRVPGQHGPPAREHVPPGTLKQLGLNAGDSSQFQLLARLPQREFDARLLAVKESGRQLSVAPFLRAANRFATHRGRSTTTAATQLRGALRLLREVRTLETADEQKLAREVIHLAAGWSRQLRRRRPRTVAAREDELKRVTQCILCGRSQPAGKPPACPHCGGQWLIC